MKMRVSTAVKAAASAVTAVTGATLLQKWVEKREQQQGGTDERVEVTKDLTKESASVPQGDVKIAAKNTEYANGIVHTKSFTTAGFSLVTSLANTSVFQAKSLAGNKGDKQSKSDATPDLYYGKSNATRGAYFGQSNDSPYPYYGKCNATSPNHDSSNTTPVSYHGRSIATPALSYGKSNTAPGLCYGNGNATTTLDNGKSNASPIPYYGKNNTASGLYYGNATTSPNTGKSNASPGSYDGKNNTAAGLYYENATTSPYHGNSNAAPDPYHVESNTFSGHFHKFMTTASLVKRLISDGISAAHSHSLIFNYQTSLSVNSRSAQGDGPCVPLWTEGRDFFKPDYVYPKYIPGPDSTLYDINSDILDYDSDCDISSDIFDMDDGHFSFFDDSEIFDIDSSDDSPCDSESMTDSLPLDTTDSYSPWDDITFSEYYDTSDISTFDFAAPRASDAPSL